LAEAFELLRGIYDAPTVSVHLAYHGDGRLAASPPVVAAELRQRVLPAMERATGRGYDSERLRYLLQLSSRTTAELFATLKLGRLHPSPVDAYFGLAGALDPVLSIFRGTEAGLRYYRQLRREAEARAAAGWGPPTPSGNLNRQRHRLVFDGFAPWAQRQDLWHVFSSRGAAFVGVTHGFTASVEADGGDPLDQVAAESDACSLIPDLFSRIDRLTQTIRKTRADGFVVQADGRCEALAETEQTVLDEVERRSGRPGMVIDSAHLAARIDERSALARQVERFLQCVEKRRGQVG
jgi:benzoyl-CoA reductase/2-hydroxyglutaryl-CoA dehydratase subunit BcrC/BadD/HgdB